MNSDKQSLVRCNGNALIYVLLALALLGGLTMILAKSANEDSDTTYERNELIVTKTVSTAAAAKTAVEQMMMSGTAIANLIYLQPDETGFDTPPDYNKVFHPDGGGLSISNTDSNLFAGTDTAPKSGWYMGRFNNVEWTPTTANDIVFVAYDINQSVCAALNKKITNSTAIPLVSGATTEQFFVSSTYGGAANTNFMKANCAACDGYPSLCVGSAGGTTYTYYNIISAQ